MNTRIQGFNGLSQLLLAICLVVCHAQNLTFHQDDSNDIVCRVFKSSASYEQTDNQLQTFDELDAYECHTSDGIAYDLNLPQHFIDSHPRLDLGSTEIAIPSTYLDDATVTVPHNATITVLPEQRRLKKATTGDLTILVVRVSKLGKRLNPPTYRVRDLVFGERSGTFASQMDDCSFGKFKIHKAQGPGIVNGIFDIDLDFNSDNMRHRDLERMLVPKLDPLGGEAAFDHVMYCLPYGTRDRANTGNKNWVAYALLNHGRSVYNEQWCGNLSSLMHETGHNLGLHHANQGGFSYADLTGMMGFASKLWYNPQSCYNAQKNIHLGWYDDASIDLSSTISSQAWGGKLVAFVDYDKVVEDDVVIVRIGDVFVQYNRRRDFNSYTREFPNRVVIVSSSHPRAIMSNLEAGIAKDISGALTTFAYPNFQGSGHDLVFEVCDQVYGPPDYVHLSIHLDDGVQSSMCSVPLNALPDAPSSSPTSSPTASPTNSPVQVITPSPTMSPSASPTEDVVCADTTDLVPVSSRHGNRTCAWIGGHKSWKIYLCREGYEAFEQCQVTCNSCDSQVTNPEQNDSCEDSKKQFYVNKRLGHMRCYFFGQFLSRNPRLKPKFCAPDQNAYHECPETCGKCTDSCEDQPNKSFYVNRRQGYRDCAWLVKRPLWQAKLCYEGHDAYKYCNELCNSCP